MPSKRGNATSRQRDCKLLEIPENLRVCGLPQVSFAKESYKRDDILQKRPMILRSVCGLCVWLATSMQNVKGKSNINRRGGGQNEVVAMDRENTC